MNRARKVLAQRRPEASILFIGLHPAGLALRPGPAMLAATRAAARLANVITVLGAPGSLCKESFQRAVPSGLIGCVTIRGHGGDG